METLNIASNWALGPEHNGGVIVIVCMGKILFRGIVWGESGIMDACIQTKILHCNVLSPFVSTAHMSMNSELLEPGSAVFYPGTTNECVPATIVVH